MAMTARTILCKGVKTLAKSRLLKAIRHEERRLLRLGNYYLSENDEYEEEKEQNIANHFRKRNKPFKNGGTKCKSCHP